MPFHPFLRRALTGLKLAPAQLNANAYRVLISCYVLWAKHFAVELPFRAFQNLYHMKLASSSSGFYYFQGFKGTFITGCPDFDKQFKHLWFYMGGRWLHGHLAYKEVPRSERVPVVFRMGYVWTRAPRTSKVTLAMVEALQDLTDPERSQNRLLSPASLREHGWLGSSSTSGQPDDQPRTSGDVTIACMAEPAIHYRSRTSGSNAPPTPGRSRVPRGGLATMVHDPQSGDPSPGTWGPGVADEDLNLVIWELYPTRGI